MKEQPIFSLMLKGIALAMGVGVIALGMFKAASAALLVSMLGLGLTCLAMWAMETEK